MVKILVDPGRHAVLNVREVEHHSAVVQVLCFDRNHRAAIMTVQIAAFAIVIEQPMPVTKIDFTRYGKHGIGSNGLVYLVGLLVGRPSKAVRIAWPATALEGRRTYAIAARIA